MRSQLFLIPAAIVASAVPAQAKIYMSIEEAQQRLYPGVKLEQTFVTLDQSQYNAIIDDASVTVYSRNVKAWRAPNGGWFIVDQVRGKDDWVSYAIAIDEKGSVRAIEILECLEEWDGITNAGWRRQFHTKTRRFDPSGIHTISGATLSSEQMIGGVRRILSTVALVLAPMNAGRG